ncbi:MAG: hypothetical protein WCB94_06940 [Terriglobales bacterium]
MKRLLVIGVLLALVLSASPRAAAQGITEQKEVTAFLFGTFHPLNADGTPMKDAHGQPIAVEMPLGTGFFVMYPDKRGGPTFGFCYLATAKHVLRDFDGTFLSKLKVRLNLKKPVGDIEVDFVNDVAVTDASANLLWLHDDKDPADEAVAIPLLPDEHKFEFKTIPLTMFVDDAQLKSDAVVEGDNLYFIGLMAQFYGARHNYPIVRRGTLAMMSDEKIDTPAGPQKAFITELQSWPGNSGSPVFLSLGGLRGGSLMVGQKFSFLGILTGAFQNKLVAPIVGEQDIKFKSGNELPTGVSFIVPATRLREVLESQEAQRRRDAEINGLSR